MIPEVGTWSLTLTVLVCALSTLAAVGSASMKQTAWLSLSRQLVGLAFVLLTVAIWALARAFLDSNFALAYVASYSERALPWGYKLAAVWAGQEGSILLWAWLLALMNVVFVIQTRRQSGTQAATSIATLSVILGFFALLMVFAANPFQLGPFTPPDGHGLNPLLQHPSMIAHPPLLFVGYAGLAIPFAALMGVLIAGKGGDEWVVGIRRWLLMAWVFLTVGILLGAQWAYVELGWGGYWAWDPVENASLLPWLTATALVHSIGCQRRFGLFRRYNAWLIVASFLLCILATYLTRSGVIQSVHAFGESLVGTFFLVFLLVGIAVSALTIVVRRRVLAGPQELPAFLSRPGMFLLANSLLVLMTIVVAVGTMFPLISGPFVDEPISVGPPFYNKVIMPMALALMAMMAFGPLLRVSKNPSEELIKTALIPTALGVIGVIVALAVGQTNPWALASVLVVVTAAGSIVTNLYRLVRQRMAVESESFGSALVRLVDSDHRRFGGQIVHIGMFMIVVGTAGSSLFNVDQTVQLQPGQSATVGDYTIQYDRPEVLQGRNYIALQADVAITNQKTNQRINLLPQMRDYHKSEQMHAEVALRSSLVRDIYLTLVGWEQGGNFIALRFMMNPLIAWLWLGGLVMTLGTLFCLFPAFIREPRAARASAVSNRARVIHLASPTCTEAFETSMETV